MKRRDLLAVLGGSVLALRASAAESAEPVRVGFVSAGDEKGAAAFVAALRDGLAAEGYHEPDTLSLECLYADYSRERVLALVAELERRHVELIVTHAEATPIVVKGYRTVPVVYEFSADPVATGIATDLAHPLFNATGVTLMKAELNSKRLEFLHEFAPEVHRVAVITNPLHPGEEREREDLGAQAEQLGIHLAFFSTPNRAEPRPRLECHCSGPSTGADRLLRGFCRREPRNDHQFRHQASPPSDLGLGNNGEERCTINLWSAPRRILSPYRLFRRPHSQGHEAGGSAD